jgi:hypothetical protein
MQFTDKDFSDLALAAFFILSHRHRGTPTIELAKEAAIVAEKIIDNDRAKLPNKQESLYESNAKNKD